MGLPHNLGRLSPAITSDASLNIGIGVTPSGTYKLQVNGTVGLSGALTGTSATFSGLITSTIGVNNYLRASNTSTDGLFIENSNNGNTSYYGINNSTGSLFFTGSTAYSTNIGNASARDFHIGTNGIVRATITSSGNVGIGTTSPATAKLEVFASIPSLFTADSQANTLTYGGSIFYRNHTGAGEGNGIAFNLNNASNNRAEYAYIGGIIQTNTAGSENGAILFATSSSGARTERMRITSGGNVLISSTTSVNAVFKLQVGDGTADTRSTFRTNNAVPLGVAQGNTGGHYYIGASSSTTPDMIFSNWEGSERVRFTDSGNVLIGTTTDAGFKLDVNGTGRFSGAVTAAGFNSYLGTVSAANVTWVTIYTIPSTQAAEGVYNVYAHYNDDSGGMAFTQVLADRTHLREINNSDGATVLIQLSGRNIQVQHSYGVTVDIQYSILWQKLR